MTSSPPTVFRHAASTGRPTPSGSLGIAPELAKKARDRVKWFAFAMMVMSLIGVAYTLIWNALNLLDQQSYPRQLLVFGINSAVATAIWWIARNPRYRDTTVLHLGLVLEFLICLGAAIGTNMGIYAKHGDMAELTWVTPIIILFPLIVPYPPRRMLVASLITACTEPIAVLIMWFALPISRDPRHFEVLIQPVLAAGLAYYAARIIWGLNEEVSRARRLGSYMLEEKLGRGGMGEVWRASHQLLARPAAVKLIHPEALAADALGAQSILARFEQEAQATASLRSPHTVELYDFGRTEDGAFYYVMELLDGLDMATLVEKHGPLEPARVIHLLDQACHSLEEAHRAGLIHRDIKPANLVVCRYGTDEDFVKVLDFGLVKEVSAQGAEVQQLTQQDVVQGTPAFMPPELALAEKKIDGRADLYALGCVAYWLLTGTMLFTTESPMQTLMKHVNQVPDAPSKRAEIPIPSELDALVLQCLEKDPTNRPASAATLSAALRSIPLERAWGREDAGRWWDTHHGESIGSFDMRHEEQREQRYDG